MNAGKILIIGKNWPEPSATAAGVRMQQLTSCFSDAGYQITFASTSLPNAFSADLGQFLDAAKQVKVNDDGFDSWIRGLQPDVVLFDRFMTEEQFGWRVAEQAPSAVRLLDTEDLHSLRLARQEALRKNREFAIQDWLQHECTFRELASIYRCDLSLLISDYELRLLTEYAGTSQRLLHHTPFLLDPVMTDRRKPFEQRKGFIFIGNGLHSPNTDAVRWLSDAIWPLIRSKLPDASIDICGAYLPRKIQELHDPDHGFNIIGWVENAGLAMENARLQLAPLRFGAGLKGKLALAMACGTPSITTSIGAEGMHGGLPWAGRITDDPEHFAREAALLYTNKIAWENARDNGRDIINRIYSKDQHGNALIGSINALRKNLNSHRAANVVGAMLGRNGQASTKYMSRWIEAKNALKNGP